MIRSFGDKETERIWRGVFSKNIPSNIQAIARRKLRMINNAQDINDLQIPPRNKLEKLTGNLSDYYSIRINKQWRVILQWIGSDAYEVQIIDYH